jgi:hypothetical protein
VNDNTLPFGETQYGVWLGEVLNHCIRQDGAKVAVQMNLLYQKVKSEPECAQMAVQLLAQEIEANPAKLVVWRMALGSITLAYNMYRHNTFGDPIDQYPPELADFIQRHPVVVECVMYASDRLA